MVLRWFRPQQNLLLPGVREEIVNELSAAWRSSFSGATNGSAVQPTLNIAHSPGCQPRRDVASTAAMPIALLANKPPSTSDSPEIARPSGNMQGRAVHSGSNRRLHDVVCAGSESLALWPEQHRWIDADRATHRQPRGDRADEPEQHHDRRKRACVRRRDAEEQP
jgi:hypothetical protein